MEDKTWNEIADALQTEGITRVHLSGPPGIGKTHFAIDILGGTGNVAQTTLNEDVSDQEMKGHYIPEGQSFVWHDGPFVGSFRAGKPLIINEIGRASQAVQDSLLAVLDDPGIAAMTLPSGETIRPGAGFKVIATSNSAFSELPEALRDRFDAHFEINRPHPKLVAYLDSMLVGLGGWIYNSYADPQRAISPRRAISFCKYHKRGFEAAKCASLAFGSSMANDVIAAMRASGISL